MAGLDLCCEVHPKVELDLEILNVSSNLGVNKITLNNTPP